MRKKLLSDDQVAPVGDHSLRCGFVTGKVACELMQVTTFLVGRLNNCFKLHRGFHNY